MKETKKDNIEKGIELVIGTINKGRGLLSNKRKKTERRKTKNILIDRGQSRCRFLDLKNRKEGMAYCRHFKSAIFFPSVCNRCFDYVWVKDRRAGADRRN